MQSRKLSNGSIARTTFSSLTDCKTRSRLSQGMTARWSSAATRRTDLQSSEWSLLHASAWQYRVVTPSASHLLELVALARARVLAGPEANVGASLEPRLQGVVELVRAGELVVAFEILLDNLLDYDISMNQAERRNAQALGISIGVDPTKLIHLQELGYP